MAEVAKGLCEGPSTASELNHRFGGANSWRAVILRPKLSRLVSVLSSLSAVLEAGMISYGMAATMRVKLQFLPVIVGFGARVGRSALSAFNAVRRGS